MERTIHVSKNLSGDSVIEAWLGDKKITAYLPVGLQILLVHGTGKDADITDENDFYNACQWLADYTQ